MAFASLALLTFASLASPRVSSINVRVISLMNLSLSARAKVSFCIV